MDGPQVRSANAGVEVAKANLEEMKAKFRDAERNWFRVQKLGPSEALAQSTGTLSTDQVSLCKALGGGWNIPPEMEKESE